MEYPFKDLMPLDEATARTGYYRDWSHIDADTFHQISELVTFIREKGYGVDTREAIAQALERVYHDAAKSGNADMELSMARKHFEDLASRLDASDSELSSAIAQLAQKAMQSDLDIERARIDSFTSLDAGSTTGDAELIDARVGNDGKTYPNAGGAIRGQVSQLKETIAKLTEISRNIWTYGNQNFTRYIDITGVSIPSGQYTISAVVTTGATKSTAYLYGTSGQLAKFDLANSTGRQSKTFTISGDCNRVVIYAYTSNEDSVGISASWVDIQIEQGSTATEYVSPITAKDAVARVENDIQDAQIEKINNDFGYEYVNYLPMDWLWFGTNGYGITWTNNGDGTFSVSGISSVQTDQYTTITLEPGSYQLSGLPIDSYPGQNYWVRILWADNSFTDFYGDYQFRNVIELSETTTFKVYVMIAKNVQVNVRFELMLRKISTERKFVPYGEAVPMTLERPLAMLPWLGKKANFIGDSWVQGNKGNWVLKIAGKLGLETARNYGIGGRRVAYYGDGGNVTADMSVVAKFSEMDTDADIVVMYAGTNDHASQVPLGDANSLDNLTFNGALNIIMKGLRQMYPTSLVIICGIASKYSEDNFPITIKQYNQCIKERCSEHHFVFYDTWNNCGFDFRTTGNRGLLTDDGIHPNELGSNILARKLSAFINMQ